MLRCWVTRLRAIHRLCGSRSGSHCNTHAAFDACQMRQHVTSLAARRVVIGFLKSDKIRRMSMSIYCATFVIGDTSLLGCSSRVKDIHYTEITPIGWNMVQPLNRLLESSTSCFIFVSAVVTWSQTFSWRFFGVRCLENSKVFCRGAVLYESILTTVWFISDAVLTAGQNDSHVYCLLTKAVFNRGFQ